MVGLIHYLDDFLIVAKDRDTCHRFMQGLDNLCATLDIPVADDKTCGPVQVLVYLGIEIDIKRQIIRLSDERLDTLLTMLHTCKDKKTSTNASFNH